MNKSEATNSMEAKKETVLVVVRGRLAPGEQSQWQFVGGNCVQREDAGAFNVNKAYSGSNNEEVFEDIRHIVDGSMDGISGGIFAYGVRPQRFTRDESHVATRRTAFYAQSEEPFGLRAPLCGTPALGLLGSPLPFVLTRTPRSSQQTGSGKTHTMRGRPDEPGVVHRTVRCVCKSYSH